MNKEIKEILDYFKRSNKNRFGFEQDKLISYEEAQILLDYITNLQEENETLKAKLDIGKTCGFCTYYKYKQRIDKAIEYIETHKVMTQGHYNGREWVYQYFELTCEPNDLLNILKGSVKE